MLVEIIPQRLDEALRVKVVVHITKERRRIFIRTDVGWFVEVDTDSMLILRSSLPL